MRIQNARKPALVALVVLVLVGSGLASPLAQRGPRNLGRGIAPGSRTPGAGPAAENRAPIRAPIQEMIEGFYVSRFQQELALEDEQFVQLLPSLRKSLDERNRLSQRHRRTLNALGQALQDGAPDEELNRLIQDLDETDRQLREVQENLLREVDPTLSPRQRARFRIVQPNVENRIRELIERSRGAAASRPRPGG